MNDFTFETGPIRPPSEADSLLLRLTRNCPWNKCAFCSVYKGQEFSRRSVEEIKSDIDAVSAITEEIRATSARMGFGGDINRQVLLEAAKEQIYPDDFYRIGVWLYYETKTVFLQDANSLIMKTEDIVEVLTYLRQKFPAIERITSYARSKTISKKSMDELKALREAGLTRIHIGMESGSDRVLDMINKGVTAEEHISAGQKAMQAGFDLSEYYMPGLGGRGLSADHATQSAKVLSAINPTFIRIRSTIPVPGTPLFELMEQKKWLPLTEEETVRELRDFIEKLNCSSARLVSDHMMNMLEDLEGDLPGDKSAMLNMIDSFLNMETALKENFIIGRRLGIYRYYNGFKPDPRVKEIREEILRNFASVDDAIFEIMKKNTIL